MSHGSGFLWVLVSPVLFAQSVVSSDYAGIARQAFEQAPSATRLVCSVTPVPPLLDFGLHFHTGYVLKIPLAAYRGGPHNWAVLLRLTPKNGEPVYFGEGLRMPAFPAEGDVNGIGRGGFLVGAGGYQLDMLVEDDLQRVCQSQWRIRAKEPGGARPGDLSIAPGAVRELASEPTARQPSEDVPLERLTILVQAAPLLRSHSTLQDVDIAALAEMSTSLLVKLPARSVRLVVFNLSQQVVLFQCDPPARCDIHGAIQAMRKLQLAEVSYAALRDPSGSVALLDSLVREEMLDGKPSGVVVFLGPRTDSPGIPRQGLAGALQGAPRFFYVQYAPPCVVVPNPTQVYGADLESTEGFDDTPSEQPYLPAPTASDPIEHLVKSLKGETFVVRKPADLASAIRRITRTTGAGGSLQVE